MNIDPELIDGIADRVRKRTREFEAEMQKRIKPYGLRRLPDDKFITWYLLNSTVKFPPIPLMAPNGQTVVISPWVAMLPYVKGGDAVLKRWVKLAGAAAGQRQGVA